MILYDTGVLPSATRVGRDLAAGRAFVICASGPCSCRDPRDCRDANACETRTAKERTP